MKRKKIIPLVSIVILIVLIVVGGTTLFIFKTREKKIIKPESTLQDKVSTNGNENTTNDNVEEIQDKEKEIVNQTNDETRKDFDTKIIEESKDNTSEVKKDINSNSSDVKDASGSNVSNEKADNPLPPSQPTAWEELGVSEYDYYNSPAWKWARVDFKIETYGSEEACRKACIDYGENNSRGYACHSINSYSGRYLGEMIEMF